MRTIFFALVLLFLGTASFGQEGKRDTKSTRLKAEEPSITLPAKEGTKKQIYELEESVDYKVFDQYGKMIAEGNGKEIDYTDYKIGTYFVLAGDEKRYFEKKE